MGPTDERPTLSTREAAAILGVSMQTVQRWVDLGQLLAWKTLGGHRRIDRAGVDQLLLARPSRPTQAPVQSAASGDTGVKVMVVDDDASDRKLLAGVCRQALPGALIDTFSNGFDALLAIGQSTPDVLVTDVMMPNLNAFEMLARLMQSPELCPPLVVATSSHTREELAAFGQLPESVRFVQKASVAVALTDLLRRPIVRAPGI